MAWIIRNQDDHDLCWSNEQGWVEETYDTFSDEERESLNLPIDGEWEQVPWNKGEPSPYELYERTGDERLRTVM